MKTIAFLLGSPEISGGTNVIYEHASRLHRGDFDVTILTEKPVSQTTYSWHPEASQLNWRTIDETVDCRFDFVIATWWQSVFSLERVAGNYYVYFVQSIESRFFEKRDSNDPDKRDGDIVAQWCESTYLYPLPVITEARWIKKYLRKRYNRDSHLVPNGIRKDIFCEEGSAVALRDSSKLRVLVEGPLGVFFKNVEKTIELCLKAEVPEIWLLTSSDVSDYQGVDRCFSQVPIEKTPEIYRSCDVLVKLSYVEGMFGPPLEIFHCGGTAIVYDVTGHDEYIKDGVNGIVLRKGNEDGVVAWLSRLQEDEKLLSSLKNGARKTAKDWWNWDSAAKSFGESLLKIEATEPIHARAFLQEYNKKAADDRDNAFTARQLQRYDERERRVAAGDVPIVNHVQIYWDEGQGLSSAIQREYRSGKWQQIDTDVPVKNGPVTLRIDPSVLIGFVTIRCLDVYEKESGKILRSYGEHNDWSEIFFTGTAVCLQKQPYPVLHAFGEDPQMILPDLEQVEGRGGITVRLEVFEMSFSEHYQQLSSAKKSGSSIAGQMKTLLSKMMGKIS